MTTLLLRAARRTELDDFASPRFSKALRSITSFANTGWRRAERPAPGRVSDHLPAFPPPFPMESRPPRSETRNHPHHPREALSALSPRTPQSATASPKSL